METSQELDIKRYLRLVYQKRYLFVAVMTLVTTAVVAFSYVMPKKYEATSTVLVERNFLNDVMKGIASTPSIDDRAQAVSTLMKSRSLVLRVIKDLDLDLTKKSENEVEMLIQAFQRATDIKIDVNKSRKDMDMFTVSLKHKNPVIARDYVNGLVRRYIEESLSSKRDETYGASKFLVEQVDLFKEKINTIEASIERLKKVKGVGDQGRLATLQKRLDELLLQYTDKHPEVVKIKDEIWLLKRQLKNNRRTPAAGQGIEDNASSPGDQAAVADTEKKSGRTEAGLGANDPNERAEERQGGENASTKIGHDQKIKELERDRDTYRKIYEEMLAALGKSEVSSHIEVQDKGGTFKVLEPAVLPIQPISPNRVMMILLGLLAGVGIGAGTVILLDNMDKSVRSTDALKDFGLPVLAVIPHIELPEDIERTKRKDRLLYAFAAVYLAGVSALLAVEVVKQIS